MNIGILGAGQLGRMLALAGYPLGFRFRSLAPDAGAPAGRLSEMVVAEYGDEAALRRFADGLDAVTYEFENVPVETARLLAERVPTLPPPRALEVAQDRLLEKRFFNELGVGTAPFAPVDSRAELDEAVARIGLPAVLKTRRWGYDGKGQRAIRRQADVDAAWDALGGSALILEGFVAFRRELSILAARARDGEIAFYPLVENEHAEGILRISRAPARALTERLQRAGEEIARRALEALDYVGLLAIELFDTDDGLLANEMAPRVHNSGHWSIEGAVTSQFENHLRAVAGLPLGATEVHGAVAMLNILGRSPPLAELLRLHGAAVHLYDKAPRPGRKLGHVTLREPDSDRLEQRVAELTRVLDAALEPPRA